MIIQIVHSRLTATIPERIKTIGDLCEEAAGASFASLYAERGSCHPRDIWRALTVICRSQNDFRDEIDERTTFFKVHASAA